MGGGKADATGEHSGGTRDVQLLTCHLQVELVEGVNKHVVGEGLDIVEQQWLVGHINEFLEATNGEPVSIAASESRVQVGASWAS